MTPAPHTSLADALIDAALRVSVREPYAYDVDNTPLTKAEFIAKYGCSCSRGGAAATCECREPDEVPAALAQPAAGVPCYMCDGPIAPGEAFHVVTRYEGRVVAQVHDACERAWLAQVRERA